MTTLVPSIKSLAPDDYALIESEHARMEWFLHDIKDTCLHLDDQLACDSCGSLKLASCYGRLPSFLHNLMEITDKHFHHEESIMLSRPHVTENYEYFRVHRQAHLDIMQALKEIAGDCASFLQQKVIADGYRQLYQRVSGLFEDHDRLFDDPFIQSTYASKVGSF